VRSKAHQYRAAITTGSTFASGTDCIGVTGDFDGGYVQANVSVTSVVGAGQWITLQFTLDGVAVSPAGPGAYQSGASVSLVLAEILRVPSGRHRIGARFSAGAAPSAASCTAQLSVAELPA
jgi:hypothetical protein